MSFRSSTVIQSTCILIGESSFSFALLEGKVAGLTTVAFEGLEVPSEFIDVPVRSLDESDWIAAIELAKDASPKSIDMGAYSTKRMMLNTLGLALWPPGNYHEGEEYCQSSERDPKRLKWRPWCAPSSSTLRNRQSSSCVTAQHREMLDQALDLFA